MLYCICVIQLPAFFDGHHSYDIYDANMTFENNLPPQGWSTDSRQSYRMFLESSRLAMKVSFSQTSLDLIKITKDVDQGKIEARWRVRGRPRYLLSLKERSVTSLPLKLTILHKSRLYLVIANTITQSFLRILQDIDRRIFDVSCELLWSHITAQDRPSHASCYKGEAEELVACLAGKPGGRGFTKVTPPTTRPRQFYT